MISDFIWLELIEQNTSFLHFSCNLPDPDIYGDEKMVTCGEVLCHIDNLNNKVVFEIELYENFKTLCVGDCYQRRGFVNSIIVFIRARYEFDLQLKKIHICLHDCWGTYFGNQYSIDETFWEC